MRFSALASEPYPLPWVNTGGVSSLLLPHGSFLACTDSYPAVDLSWTVNRSLKLSVSVQCSPPEYCSLQTLPALASLNL